MQKLCWFYVCVYVRACLHVVKGRLAQSSMTKVTVSMISSGRYSLDQVMVALCVSNVTNEV